jgi:hypothetical protein
MANHRSRDLDAAVSPKAEAEREVDVFDIAEEPLIDRRFRERPRRG